MKIKAKVAAIAASSALVLSGGGYAAFSAVSASAATAPAATNLYGCVVGTNRVLQNVYTNQTNFESFLNANGGKCPSGFAVTVQSGTTSPSPSPSPTSTGPTPTPTPTTTGTVACEVKTLDRSVCGPFNDPNVVGGSNDGGATVRQEVWNPQPQLTKQDTKVFSGPLNFTSTINAAKGNTAVNSYPDISDTVTTTSNTPAPISGYNSLVSTYTENMNANTNTDAEAAYDIWLNDYGNELMIWVDNHGQRPAGNDTGSAITVGGVNYEVWDTGDHGTVSVVRSNAPSGTTDILGIIKALQAKGIYSSTAGLNQVDFGFETPSTGGVDEDFTVSAYTLKFT
jgi:hypothetical protein